MLHLCWSKKEHRIFEVNGMVYVDGKVVILTLLVKPNTAKKSFSTVQRSSWWQNIIDAIISVLVEEVLEENCGYKLYALWCVRGKFPQ